MTSHKKAQWPLLQIVEIDWVDSARCSGWDSVDSKKREQDVSVCRSVGYLLSSDKEKVRLVSAQSLPPYANVCDGMSIPRCAIRKQRWIRQRNPAGRQRGHRA